MDEETKRNERERDRLLLIKLNKFLPLVNLEVFLVHALPLVLSGTSRGKLGSLGRPPLSSSTYSRFPRTFIRVEISVVATIQN